MSYRIRRVPIQVHHPFKSTTQAHRQMNLVQTIFVIGCIVKAGFLLRSCYLTSMAERENRLKAARCRWGLSEPGLFDLDDSDKPAAAEANEDDVADGIADGAFWE